MKKITLLLLFYSVTFFSQQVTTLAGSTAGDQDGLGSAAQFNEMEHIVTDVLGNIYVAEAANNKIKKVTPEGVVTTFAGSTLGYQDGMGANAKFKYPYGLAIDPSGNIYVADGGNHRIRKITPAGEVTTVAGSSPGGYQDGNALEAKFTYPFGLNLDSNGNIIVVETYGHKIRKITPSGIVSTIAGSVQGFEDGDGATALFNHPFDVVCDAQDNLYITDIYNHRVRKIDPSGMVTTFVGGVLGDLDGVQVDARLSHPSCIDIDSNGDFFITDNQNHKIKKITSNGTVSTFCGTTQGYEDGDFSIAKFNNPAGIAVLPSGIIYISDFLNNKLRKIEPANLSVNLFKNQAITIYPNPTSDFINLEIQDSKNFKIQIYNLIGKEIGTYKNQKTIDVSNLNSGIYLVKITDLDTNHTTSQKISKK